MRDENNEGFGKDGRSCEVGRGFFTLVNSEDNIKWFFE